MPRSNQLSYITTLQVCRGGAWIFRVGPRAVNRYRPDPPCGQRLFGVQFRLHPGNFLLCAKQPGLQLFLPQVKRLAVRARIELLQLLFQLDEFLAELGVFLLLEIQRLGLLRLVKGDGIRIALLGLLGFFAGIRRPAGTAL